MVRSLARRVFTLDLRSLALCRIAVGIVVIGDLLTRVWSFRIHYTDLGVLPRQALFDMNILRFPSLHAASGWEPFVAGVFLLHGVVALLVTLGYRTRFYGAILWYLTVSLQQRLYMANNGGDTVMAAVLFWGMFLPWGEALSMDASGRLAREPKPAADIIEEDSLLKDQHSVLSAATVVFSLQVLLMYYVSVVAKMEPNWLKGEVLYYAFQSDLYARPIALWLLPHTTLMRVLVFTTLAWEIVGPLLLISTWPRVRATSCLLFALMHLGFGVFLRIGTFAFSPMLFVIALLPGIVWEGRRGQGFAHWLEGFFARLARRQSPPPGRRVSLSAPVSAGLGLLFCYTLLTSIGEDPRIGKILPPQLDWVAQMTGLYQRWGVFVDMPNILDGWVVVEGRLSDGREVDLFQGTNSVSWDKPPTPFSHYKSYRWPTPLVVITGDSRLHRWFVRALALDWERRYPGQKVTWARFTMMAERTQPGFRDFNVERRMLWEGSPLED